MTIRSGFEDVEQIADPDGVVAVITRHKPTGTLSVAIFKTFVRDGEPERTNFFRIKHFAAVRRVLETAEKRLAILEANKP